MEKGWDAAGLLEPLWGRVGKRDGLAALTGIPPSTISGYNTGRLPLGRRNAEKIAVALGVSILDLGAPAESPDAGWTVPERLAELEATVRVQGESTTRALRALAKEVRALARQLKQEDPPATEGAA